MSGTMVKQSPAGLLIMLMLACLPMITFAQSNPPLEVFFNTPANAGIMSETCSGPYELVFVRDPGNVETIEIFFSATGQAQANLDYTFSGPGFPIIMSPEETVVTVTVNPVDDGLIEGFEDILWEFAYLSGQKSDVAFIETGIIDAYSVEITSINDTLPWCRFEPLVLQAVSDATIHWSPSPAFDPTSGPEVTVRPFVSAWYFAAVGGEGCEAKDSIYLDLAIANIASADTLFICLDESGVILQGQIQGLATTFTWTPSDSTLSNPLVLNPIANPTVTTTYILSSNIGVCIASDTVVVKVDSLPAALPIAIAPAKPYYCAGEIVALFSPSYDSLSYPDLTFQWMPDNNTYLTPMNFLNVALELIDTTLYIRENVNNACVSRDSILINVVPSVVPLSVMDTMLCPGAMFDVEVLATMVTEPEWSPGDGLSCTRCLDPKVTVIGNPGSTLIYEFSGKILECPVGANLVIRIPPLQQIGLDSDPVVCAGDMVPITITNPSGLSDFQWNVVFGNASLSCSTCPDPIITINENNTINVLLTASTTNPNFCGAAGFFQFLTGDRPQVTGPPIVACQGETTVAITGNPEYTDIEWNVFNGNLSLSCNACPSPTVTVNSPGLLSFTAQSPDPDICRVFGTVAVTLAQPDASAFFIMPDPNTTEIGQGSRVMVALNVNPTTPTSIMWTVNGVNLSTTAPSIEFNANDPRNFIVATYINSKGCTQTDTISFPTVPPSFMIPNAFTPDNGDDINDNFRIIINGNIMIEKFMIFNRWGQLVYEARNDDLQGWDGRFKNQPAPSDTYVYTATLRYPDGRLEVAKGDVLLLK